MRSAMVGSLALQRTSSRKPLGLTSFSQNAEQLNLHKLAMHIPIIIQTYPHPGSMDPFIAHKQRQTLLFTC